MYLMYLFMNISELVSPSTSESKASFLNFVSHFNICVDRETISSSVIEVSIVGISKVHPIDFLQSRL